MNPHLSTALAQTRIADMHKAAASFTTTKTPTDDSVAHERQRTRVLASLLLARREDPPTHRRSA